MSTANQSNGKKPGSTNNSTTNTPSSTPVSTIGNPCNSQVPLQSTSPPNNAPKYGTLVPNRIFVGGISANTTEAELLQLFSNYGTVKAAKIIQDRAGVSKGYGFITFESEEEAKRLQREADNIVLRERKLNIAPAIKKQPFNRAFDASSPPTITPGGPAQYFIPAGGVPFYQGGVTYYPQPPPPQPGDPNNQHQQPPVFQPPAVFPAHSGPPQTAPYPSLMYQTQPIYMTQQFPYQPMPYDYNYYPNGGPPQYMVGNQGTPQPQPPPMQPPGSPPRTPCYNPQLPYGSDAVYYNVPLYGPMEGATVYQDSLDVTNGNLTEEPFGFTIPVSQDMGALSLPNNSTNSDLTNTSTTTIDTTRQSNTPVVSLLAIDQHQEKDFTSLQSGRRRKSIDQPSVNFGPPNGFGFFPTPRHLGGMNFHAQQQFNGYGFPPPMNSFKNASNNVWYKRRNRDNRGWNTESHTTRTDSNSPASVVDENRNEEKTYKVTNSSPPPAPYSPIMQYGIMANKHGNIRNFSSNRRGGGGYAVNMVRNNNNNTYSNKVFNNTNRSNSSFMRKNGTRNYKNSDSKAVVDGVDEMMTNDIPDNDSADVASVSETANVIAGNFTLHSSDQSKSPPPLPPQVPTSTQNFIPPARRPRRSARRNAHAGAPLSEIGAGDAPIPNTEVGDACKKLDNLKL